MIDGWFVVFWNEMSIYCAELRGTLGGQAEDEEIEYWNAVAGR